MTLVNAPLIPNVTSRNMSNETMNNDFLRYDLLNISDYEVLYGDIITSTIHNASCQTLENFTGCTQGNMTEEDGSSGYFYKVRDSDLRPSSAPSVGFESFQMIKKLY